MLSTSHTPQNLHRLKSKGWKKNIPSKCTEKKTQGSNIYIRHTRLINKCHKKNTKGHFIILKGRIHQEDINIINIYAPIIGAPKYIRKILEDFNKDIYSNTLLLGDFNTHCQKWIEFPKKISTMILQHCTMPKSKWS